MKNADGYKEVKEIEEYEVDGDEGETATNPGVQKDKNNPEECMDMSGNNTLPPPVVTSQEPPNQTIQQIPFDGKCEVRTSDGEGLSQTADEGQSYYVNEDEDPSLNVHWPLTKNPAYGLPPVGILQSDHDQTADESQSYVNEDEDPSLNVHWPLTKNPDEGTQQ